MEVIMNSVERVKKICKERKIPISRLEKDLNFANGYIGQLKKGVFPDDRLKAIADYLNVQSAYLTGESEFKTKEEMFTFLDEKYNKDGKLAKQVKKIEELDKKGKIIPVLGDVAAGVPIEAIEDIIDYEEISKDMAHTGDFFGLRIKGDSMSPRISEGDVVIVRQQNDAESGDIVIVLVDGESATCKRLIKYKDGISLISFNPMYEPMNFTKEDIIEKPVTIIGKVVENRQKY